MTQTEIFNLKLNEFKSGIKAGTNSKNTSGILLFKDYLSKLYLWHEQIGLTADWENNIYKSLNGHDLLHFIAPELKELRLDLEDFRVNYLNDIIIDKSKYHGFEYVLLYFSIYWEVLKDYPKIAKYQSLPNPYESILKIILRGNHIYKGEMNTIEIDHCPVKRQADFFMPSLDADFLNYVDIVVVRSGSSGIPDQEQIHVLWEKFKLSNKTVV